MKSMNGFMGVSILLTRPLGLIVQIVQQGWWLWGREKNTIEEGPLASSLVRR